MNSFITRLHAAIREARRTRRGATKHPKEVPQGTHKTYPRMPRIVLPPAESISMHLDEVIKKRRSLTESISIEGFSDVELGTLLGTALGMGPRPPFRNFPSGGALFPMETYLVGNVRHGKSPGVFHYNPKEHALEHLWDLPATFSTMEVTTTRSVPAGSMLIVFTALWERSSAKYGDLTYSYAGIEAGHMAQNILLTATALNMSSRPLGGFDDAVVASLLDLDEAEEQAMYSVLLSSNKRVNS